VVGFQHINYIESNIRFLCFWYLSSLWTKYHRLQRSCLIQKGKV